MKLKLWSSPIKKPFIPPCTTPCSLEVQEPPTKPKYLACQVKKISTLLCLLEVRTVPIGLIDHKFNIFDLIKSNALHQLNDLNLLRSITNFIESLLLLNRNLFLESHIDHIVEATAIFQALEVRELLKISINFQVFPLIEDILPLLIPHQFATANHISRAKGHLQKIWNMSSSCSCCRHFLQIELIPFLNLLAKNLAVGSTLCSILHKNNTTLEGALIFHNLVQRLLLTSETPKY